MAGKAAAVPPCAVPQIELAFHFAIRDNAVRVVKAAPEHRPPAKLARFCEVNGFAGLGLLALLGDMSLAVASLMTEEVRFRVRASHHLFSYLLGYAVWVGAKHHRLRFPDIRQSAGALRNLPPHLATDEKESQDVARLIQEFYQCEENLKRAEAYFGPFTTGVPSHILNERCKSNLIFLFKCWDRWGWDEKTFDAALRQVNEQLVPATSFFYDEEDAVGREFANYLLLAVVFEGECGWSEEAELVRWPAATVTLSNGTQIIRTVVLGTEVLDFLPPHAEPVSAAPKATCSPSQAMPIPMGAKAHGEAPEPGRIKRVVSWLRRRR